jgi:tryptophanyl-tRNA synthetase
MRYGETFVVPKGIYPTVGARIMDLQDPLGKMGKTGSSESGTIRILDEPDVIRRKLRSAVTDSGSEVRRGPDKPGVTNLIDIYSVATGDTPEQIEGRYDGTGYGQFKGDVAEAVVTVLAPIQERYHALRADENELRRLLVHGAEKARAVSGPTLEQIYERMGFIRP